MKLNDKVVVITGASRGIGAEAARIFASRGARIVAIARDAEALSAVCGTIEQRGGNARAVPLDVTDSLAVAATIADIVSVEGGIDVLVNNAGNGGRLGNLLDQPPEHSQRMFDVHAFGTERMIRAVLPSMLERGRGRIVNVVSTVGYVPMPGAAAYCAAKAAVIAFTRALQGELADTPVALTLFSPPHTQTEAGKQWPLNLPKTFSPEFAAAAMVRAVERDMHETLAGGNGSLLLLQRAWPGMAMSIMRRLGADATRKAVSERVS